jgi:hypothetical protein
LKCLYAVCVCEHRTKHQKAADLKATENDSVCNKTGHPSNHSINRKHNFFHVKFQVGSSIAFSRKPELKKKVILFMEDGPSFFNMAEFELAPQNIKTGERHMKSFCCLSSSLFIWGNMILVISLSPLLITIPHVLNSAHTSSSS